MNKLSSRQNTERNSRAGAKLFGNAINNLRKQSASTHVKILSGKNCSTEPLPTMSRQPVKEVRELKKVGSLHSFLADEKYLKGNTHLSRVVCQGSSSLVSMLHPSLISPDEDYSLPLFGAPRSCGSDSNGFSSDSSDYSLPLFAPEFEASIKCSSSNERYNSDSQGDIPSDEGYETRGCSKKELQEKSCILRNRSQERGMCLSCEEEEFHHSQKSMQGVSALPRYNPKLIFTMKTQKTFIDAHCHLDFLFEREKFKGTYLTYQQKHKESFPSSYEGCVAVFCNPLTFINKHMCQKFLLEKNVWAAFGCHPHKSEYYCDKHENSLLEALAHPQVRALGEIGLDYSNRNHCQKETQHKVFRRQLKIALKKNLPLVIHCREAHEDALKIMKEMLPLDYRIHLHCFTDVWEHAKEWLDSFPNLYIGITNLVTFSSAKSVHNVVKNIPLSRLLLETDAPYFVPRMSPKETRFSHPGMAIHVAAQIAALRDCSLDQVLHWTRKNTRQVYGI